MKLRAPPYSKELIAARKRGEVVNVYLHAGDHSWRRVSRRRPPHILCLPPEQDFTEFDWSCIHGECITLVVWNRNDKWVDAFARHLVISGAELVAALNAEHDDRRVTRCFLLRYRPSRARRAA